MTNQLETLNEILLQESDKRFHVNIPKDKNKKDRRLSNEEEKENAEIFKKAFGTNKFRIKLLNKEYYVHFTQHAMSRWVERYEKLDKEFMLKLVTKAVNIVRHKEKNQLFLVYSSSMKRAVVIVKKAEDLFHIVTSYPEGSHRESQGTKKILVEKNKLRNENHLDTTNLDNIENKELLKEMFYDTIGIVDDYILVD